MALVGWVFDLEPLKRVLPGLVAMNPMTATLMIVLGLSLLGRIPDGGIGKAAATGMAVLVIIIATAKLVGLMIDLPNGVDTWMFADELDDGLQSQPNRMAPNTAVNFLLLGLALLLMDVRTPHGNRPTEFLAAIAGLVALLAILGYAYRINSMYGISKYIPMALHTAAAFLLLAIGTLSARTREGWMALFTARGPGGVMARRLLPALLAMLAIFGWLRIKSEAIGLVDSDLGVALYTLSIMTLSTILILLGAKSLERASSEHRQVQQQREEAFASQKQSEMQIRSIIDTAYDAFLSVDTGGKIIEWNAAAESMFGWSREECLGLVLSDLIVPPERRESYNRKLKQFIATDSNGNLLNERIESTALRRDRTEFPAVLTIWPINVGKVVTINAFISDITSRKAAEGRILKLHSELVTNAIKLEQTNRELDAFSYSVSHDLRAPLRHLDGYATMLQEDAADSLNPEMKRYLDEISAASRRMGGLIDDLLGFSRLGRQLIKRANVNMRDLVLGLLPEFTDHSGVQVVVGPLPPAYVDSALFNQVWTNLLSNAFKYGAPRGAELRIEISGECLPTSNRYSIRDNGVGFDMRYAEKLFGVFQRLHTDEEFEGTGVGLAIVQRIIVRHDGVIRAYAEPDRGATVTFEIPHVDEARKLEGGP